MSIPTFLIRTIGIGATALTAYNISYATSEKAAIKTKTEIGENLGDLWMKHSLNTDGHITTEKMKRKYFDWRLKEKGITGVKHLKNSITSFGESFMENIIPLGLGIGGICAYNSSKFRLYKGFIPKPIAGLCAIGSLGIGAYKAFKYILGWNKTTPPGFYP